MAKITMSFGMSFRPYQGRYMRVLNQALSLVEAGHEITLLAWDRECKGPEEANENGIHVVRFQIPAPVGSGPRNSLNILKFNRAVSRYLDTHPCDVVHCYNLDTIWTSLAAAKRIGAATVLDLCEPNYFAMWEGLSALLLKPINWVERYLSRKYDLLCVHNDYQVSKFQAYGHENLVKVGSYPPAKFTSSESRSFDGETVVIGRVGSVYEDNGIEELLAAFQVLLARRREGQHSFNFELLLAGRVFESYEASFRSLCERYPEALEVLGAFDSQMIPELYARIDIATMLYRRTNWFRPITPTKLFDAMSCGVPIVATDMGEVREILEDSGAGIVVDETNPDELADAFIQLAADPERRQKMTENGLRAAEQKYTWDVYKELFVRKYAEIVAL